MPASSRKKLGNLRVVPRTSAPRRPRRSPSPPSRRRRPARPAGPDVAFDNRIASVYATWNGGRKISTSEGKYPSRAIANTANRTQFPARLIAKHFEQCADADIPLHLVEQLGTEFVAQARAVYARRGKKINTLAA